MRARRFAVAISLVLLASAVTPVAGRSSPALAGDYIVVFNDDVRDAGALSAQLAADHQFAAKYVYEHALKGFAASLSGAAVDALRRNPSVAWVEADGMAFPSGEQTGATWGIDRIDQRALPLSTTYVYDATGAGVTAYVIDSGIRTSHVDFSGRASVGEDFVGDGQDGQDCNGHGTHVAGTIGGETWGVAKDVSLVSVRVFGCSGGSSWSTIAKAVDWVTANAKKPAVANMSLGGGANLTIDTAVKNSIASGISYAIAAGNDGTDACTRSPARVEEAMTIGATGKTDTKASWSNYGRCVDWFAPGVSIVSADKDSDTDTATKSGTSMATPHTAGVAALYLQAGDALPATVRDAIYAATTKDIVASSESENDHLLYNLRSESDGGTEPTTGTVSGTVTADGGGAIAGATVSVQNASFTGSTSTAGDGSYSITVPAASDYAVTAGATGYISETQSPVTVTAGTTSLVNFSLAAETASGDGSTFGVTLSGESSNQGNTWTAIVTVTATDSAGKPVSGVTVTGSWSESASATDECTTRDTGSCFVDLSNIRKRTSSVTFSVTGVTHSTTKTFDGVLPAITVLKP